jgi:hypothetical protein
MAGDPSDTVASWFGPAFGELSPMLQRLHRDGASLTGPVQIAFPAGVSGAIGRWFARHAGIPCDGAPHRLRVTIRSHAGVLHWDRRFDDGSLFSSTFVPMGRYPDGYWLESTGTAGLRLGVAIVDGGWHWRHRATVVRGMVLPAWLGPRLRAHKKASEGCYHFHVAMDLPLMGTVMSYEGELSPLL